jgi:hypothetical protein
VALPGSLPVAPEGQLPPVGGLPSVSVPVVSNPGAQVPAIKVGLIAPAKLPASAVTPAAKAGSKAGPKAAAPQAPAPAQTAAPAIHAIANGGGPATPAAPPANDPSYEGKQSRGAAATPTLKALGADSESGDETRAEQGADQAFDGEMRSETDAADVRATQPRFEPPTLQPAAPRDPAAKADGRAPEEKRLTVSFQAPMVSGLMAVDPNKSIYGTLKRVRDFPASREYWNKFKKGAEIEVVSRGVSVFGRTTKITYAVTKKIGKLTREDLKGLLPEYQLQAPIRELRRMYVDQLEEARKTWNPNDPVVSLDTTVRVVKFQSYLDLYRQTHGDKAQPEAQKPAPRLPLKVKAEGVLEPLTRFLPRAVFLDVDALDGPITPDQLSDMMKLQRTGVYFVAFSRKAYGAPGGMRDKLISKMSAYQLSILMPIRFMAVTDNGAVVSEFPKGGNVVPVSVEGFSSSQLDMLRDAVNRAAIDTGVNPNAVKELAQPAVREKVEEFPFGKAQERRTQQAGPQVRFQLSLPKSADSGVTTLFLRSLQTRLGAQGLVGRYSLEKDEEGRTLLTLEKASFSSAMPRLMDALGDKFGLYLNPSDILVLSDDEALKAANPHLDFGAVTKLHGSDQLENGLGILLGEHRENREGDLSGSASRMTQFSRDRTRYMSEFLIKQDGQEQNINFFSGHVVHAANDWLVHQLQNGKRPTTAEYEKELRRRWDEGIREFKAVGIPQGEDMEGWERESTIRGMHMYRQVVAAHDRGEVLIGTEIPNFFMLKDFKKRTEELKRRYTLHTIFDFIALRPDPKNPGHATLVIYDFKTGPAQSRQKLDKDLQVLTYALFAKLKWVGKDFMTPYLTGDRPYHIDDAKVEFIYGAIKQPTTITMWDLEMIRKKIISILNRIDASEKKLMAGPAERRAAKKKAAEAKKKAQARKAKKAREARAAK